MIIDALKLAEPKMKIAEQILDPKRYVHLTDDIMARIESSEDPVRLRLRHYPSSRLTCTYQGTRRESRNIRSHPHA